MTHLGPQVELDDAKEGQSQLLAMVNSSTAALAATATRCDELKQQQLLLDQQLIVSERQRQEQQSQLQQNRDGLVAAANAVSAMKRALADVQEAVPAALQEAQKESERDVYALVAAVTQSMSCKDKQQNTELFNRAMQVPSIATRARTVPLPLLTVTRRAAVQTGGSPGRERARRSADEVGRCCSLAAAAAH